MNLQPVFKKVDLYRCAFGEVTVIPVNDRIQHRFPDGFHGVLRLVTALACVRVNDDSNIHVPSAEIQRLIHHLRDGSINALIAEKSGIVLRYVSDFCPRHHHSSDTKLGQVPLGIDTKIHHRRQSRNAVSGNCQHLHSLFPGYLSKARAFHTSAAQILLQSVLVQQFQSSALYRSLIVVLVFPKRLVAVQFVVRHGQIGVPYPQEGALDTSPPLVVAGALSQV